MSNGASESASNRWSGRLTPFSDDAVWDGGTYAASFDPQEVAAALDLVVPLAAVLQAVATGASPDAALVDAADRYRGYWAGELPEELLAVEPCGLALLARLLGLVVGVIHPLLPAVLIDQQPVAVLACPLCAEPFDPLQRRCAWCDADLTADAPLELPLPAWLAARRAPCGECGQRVHPQALRCWSCGTERD